MVFYKIQMIANLLHDAVFFDRTCGICGGYYPTNVINCPKCGNILRYMVSKNNRRMGFAEVSLDITRTPDEKNQWIQSIKNTRGCDIVYRIRAYSYSGDDGVLNPPDIFPYLASGRKVLLEAGEPLPPKVFKSSDPVSPTKIQITWILNQDTKLKFLDSPKMVGQVGQTTHSVAATMHANEITEQATKNEQLEIPVDNPFVVIPPTNTVKMDDVPTGTTEIGTPIYNVQTTQPQTEYNTTFTSPEEEVKEEEVKDNIPDISIATLLSVDVETLSDEAKKAYYDLLDKIANKAQTERSKQTTKTETKVDGSPALFMNVFKGY